MAPNRSADSSYGSMTTTTPAPSSVVRRTSVSFRRAPHIGEHTREILSGLLDYNDEDVHRLQHAGYRLDVAAHAAAVDSTWRVPMYPDGGYYAFALPDFSEGTFGHPWEQSLCVFGSRLVNTLGETLSSWLPSIRVDGNSQR